MGGREFGDGEGAAEGFYAVGFGEDADAAGAGFFEGRGVREGGEEGRTKGG